MAKSAVNSANFFEFFDIIEVIDMSKLTQNVAQRIARETGYNDTGVIVFGLQSLAGLISNYVVLAILSFFLHVFPHAIIAALASSSLRVFSGGSHASSPLRCAIFGTVVFLMLGRIAVTLSSFTSTSFFAALAIIIALLATAAIFKYGYATTHKKPLNAYAHGRKLRIIAITVLLTLLAVILYLSYFHIQSLHCRVFMASTMAGIAWYTFCLTPLGHKVNDIADRQLQHWRL